MSMQYFNSRANVWDEEVAEKNSAKLRTMADRLDIKRGSTLLDVGTGTGVFLPFLLSKVGQEGRIVCLDFAEEMLRLAADKGFRGKIEYVCASIEQSRLSDERFDATVCYSVFPHFEDKPKALREIYRLLKKGGSLYICHTSPKEAINDIHRHIPAVHYHIIPNREEMVQLLADAGFQDIEVSEAEDSYLATAKKPQ